MGTDRTSFSAQLLLLASTCVSALLLCVWGETWAVHTHGAGAQLSVTRQLQLHPLQTQA